MNRIIQQKQSEIFEKVVSRNGRLFLVRFVIVERESKLRGRILSCEAIEALAGAEVSSEVTCLPSITFTDEAPIADKLFEEIISPYFCLDFLTSIKIRAPARVI